MVGSKSTQTRFVEIITSTTHPYTSFLNEEAEYKRGVARSENGRQETDCSKIQKCLRASCTMNIHYTHIALFEAQNKANKAQNTWYF